MDRLALAVAVLAVGFSAAAPGHSANIFGVTEGTNNLVSFDTADVNTLNGIGTITGLASNEVIVGIDFRPNALTPGGAGPNSPAPGSNVLFGLGNQGNLYTISTTTGAATLVGSGLANPGASESFDFNPTIDRIRNVSDGDDNLVWNPNTGGSSQFTDVAYVAGDLNFGTNPNIVHSGYTNSFVGSTSTQLYGIDTNLDILVTQANNAGSLSTVGATLGVLINDVGGFDIDGSDNVAYLVAELTIASASTLFIVDLVTGLATIQGDLGDLAGIGGGTTLTAIAVQPVPEPGSALLLFLGLAGISLVRKKT